ncbi:MAG: hypothetical protein AAGF50_11405, partial [Pseudomonadota bacterium]
SDPAPIGRSRGGVLIGPAYVPALCLGADETAIRTKFVKTHIAAIKPLWMDQTSSTALKSPATLGPWHG